MPTAGNLYKVPVKLTVLSPRGFAAKVGEKVLESVSAWGEPYNALVEEDQVVSSL